MSEEETKVPVWWENVLFYTNMGFFLIVWYVIGCILSSFIIQEIVFSIVSIETSLLGIFYWKIECLFDFLYRVSWLVTNFGLQIWLLAYIYNFIVTFSKSLFEMGPKTNDKVRHEFNCMFKKWEQALLFFAILISIGMYIWELTLGTFYLISLIFLIILFGQIGAHFKFSSIRCDKPSYNGESITNDVIINHSGTYHLFDPINITPIIAQFSIFEKRMNESKDPEGKIFHFFKKYMVYLTISLYLLSKYNKDLDGDEYFFGFCFVLFQFIIYRFNKSFNFFSCFLFVIKKKNTPISQLSDDNQKKTLSIDLIIWGLFILYIISFLIISALLFIWGVMWTSPIKPVRNEDLYFSYSNVKVVAGSQNSALCRLNSSDLDIVQLSGLPTLMYTLNRGWDYLLDISYTQKRNQKILLQYLFGDLSNSIFINRTTLTPWSVQIVIPQVKKPNSSDIVVQIYSGYRTPFDWSLFTENFVIKYLSLLFNDAIRFFNILTSVFSYPRLVFLKYANKIFYIETYTESILNHLYKEYSESKKADIIVGQGIGGLFAKSIWSKLSNNSTEIVFAFESTKIVGLLPSFGTNNTKSKTLVNNIYSNSIYSEFEPEFDHNFKRRGRSSSFKADEAFTSFCSTAAFCAKTSLYDPLCNEVGKDYDDQIEYAQRQYIYK